MYHINRRDHKTIKLRKCEFFQLRIEFNGHFQGLEKLLYPIPLLKYRDMGKKDDLMPILRTNESSWMVFHRGDAEFDRQIDIIQEVARGIDKWDRLECLKDFCKTKSSYQLFVFPALERRRSLGTFHFRIGCQELDRPSDYRGDVLRAPNCFTKAVEFINQFGMGLRDVSLTNILSLGGLGELRDIEYEENSATCLPCNIKTGTRLCIANEPGCGAYIFGYFGDNQPPFRFNPLHDLQSVLWTFLWKVFSNSFPADTPPLDIRIEFDRVRAGFGYFQISKAHFAADYRVKYSPTFQPVVDIYEILRTRMISQYRELESNPQVDEWDFSKCHDELIEVVQTALKTFRAQTMEAEELEGESQTEKRKAGEGDDGDLTPFKKQKN
ncbi:hypothetical protein BD410DRAFT_852318 [Rickenella mellea]|uniref:Fungal-type protein kinase domain-containing protein n=1 Tax=Rickenella mellea TaxID=50990 RepID=A0A4Y7PKQ1_9AGAM|nr:hypothetical protein BD410DRAFT_852318 [Rickenella mellea]